MARIPQFMSLVRGWALVPLISAAVFFGIYLYYAKNLALDNLSWTEVEENKFISEQSSQKKPEKQSESPDVDKLTEEMFARFFWGISAVLFATLCLVVMASSIRIVHQCANTPAVTAIAILLAAMGLFARMRWSPEKVPAIFGGTPTDQLVKVIAGNTNIPIAEIYGGNTNAWAHQADRLSLAFEGGEKRSLVPPIPKVARLVKYLSDAVWVSLLSVAVAGCFLLGSVEKKVKAKADDKGTRMHFRWGVNASAWLLRITSFTLVCGVLEVYLLHRMGSYHVIPILHKDVIFFARGLAIATGILYSGFLAAIFLPIIGGQMILGSGLVEEDRRRVAKPKRGKRIAEPAHAQIGALSAVKSIAAVISPFLMSLLAQLADSFILWFGKY